MVAEVSKPASRKVITSLCSSSRLIASSSASWARDQRAEQVGRLISDGRASLDDGADRAAQALLRPAEGEVARAGHPVKPGRVRDRRDDPPVAHLECGHERLGNLRDLGVKLGAEQGADDHPQGHRSELGEDQDRSAHCPPAIECGRDGTDHDGSESIQLTVMEGWLSEPPLPPPRLALGRHDAVADQRPQLVPDRALDVHVLGVHQDVADMFGVGELLDENCAHSIAHRIVQPLLAAAE